MARKLDDSPIYFTPFDYQFINVPEHTHGVMLGTMPPAHDALTNNITYTLVDGFGLVRLSALHSAPSYTYYMTFLGR